MKQLLQRLLGSRSSDGIQSPSRSVIVVSGLPRSGTSMMMKMLEAGGIPVLVDNLRTPDPDNPQGYYEYERVKDLDKGDAVWVGEAEGKVVKVISALLEYLPPDHNYKVAFMHRKLDEVLASQQKMLSRRGEATNKVDDAEMADLFHKHVAKVSAWLDTQPNFEVLHADYNELLAEPLSQIGLINQFFDGILDENEMTRVVNPDLYRNRA